MSQYQLPVCVPSSVWRSRVSLVASAARTSRSNASSTTGSVTLPSSPTALRPCLSVGRVSICAGTGYRGRSVELETEVDRRLDAIRALAARTVAEAGPEPEWVATGSPSEAAADIAEAFGLGHHLTAAVECILTGAAEGADGSESLHEATRLIERYLALVDQQRT